MSQPSGTNEPDINLSDHRTELNKAIISAYPTIPKLTTMIRDYFKKNPDVVAGGETLDVKVSNWIDWAISHSEEKELIEAAYQGNTNNKDLKTITQKLLPSLFLEKPLYDERDTNNRPDLPAPPTTKILWHQRIPLRRLRNTFLTSVSLTTFIVIIRLLGVFQNSELLVFDQMMRFSPSEKPDDRLLLVKRLFEKSERW
ncbi:effector-associated domain EAD1-containing protein [Nostoc sp. CHAB 5784]|uniref:effector-associated domain EAD1-containing protein n=1 Tax=Nostoc mirabile TaxID=2907820 RepID=UPI001E412148|nr:effector-associated domain EAD1-containing protein [Nostoc mirabile]MCC5670461.1 effector-associated domain EAD1-containing protein [Nostoc mirabile CHAB5784]